MINHSTKLRLLLILTLLSTAFSALKAQKTIVSGKVIDAETKEALPFVNLIFQNTKTGMSTDIDGNYYVETYYASDTIICSYLGYAVQKKKVKMDQTQVINFELVSSNVELEEVVIKYKGNPAHAILEKVYANKAANNREKYDYYNYEVYNKVQFDLNNVTEDFKNKKIFNKFQFIFDYIDTTGEKDYLPMFMTESLSDYYYRRDPQDEKEIIMAAEVSGTSNESITQFLGDMYQNVNIYENYLNVFSKSFVSPIADFGKRFYRYYLIDSLMVDGSYCYQIDFVPRQAQEPVFTGTMYIADTTYAVKKISANMSANANINFINSFEVNQTYTKAEGKYWMLKQDHLLVDFTVGENIMGLYGRKSTSYKNFKINEPMPDEFYSGVEDVIVKEDAHNKGKAFWESSRHDTLTVSQKGIYQMVDSVKNIPAFRSLVDLIQLFFTGYKEVGLFEIGPYYKLYSFNEQEGHRIRFGGRTSNNFSKRIMFNGYMAYGFLDDVVKYSGGLKYMLDKDPRQVVELQYTYDLEQLGKSQNSFSTDNILSSFLRTNPANKLTFVQEYYGSYFMEWIRGFSNKLILRRRDMEPSGKLNYFKPNPEGTFTDIQHVKTSEVSLYTRFAHKEKFVEGEFDRLSLGSKYPVLEAQASFGVKGLFRGDYEYQKIELAVSDEFNVMTMGEMEYRITGGKIFGTLPYPLLEIHNGNESYFYDELSFNLMNFYEFISDEYVTLMMTHHFDGFFLNKIPLLRKLKWREVVTLNSVWGNLSQKHQQELIFPDEVHTLDIPYVEAGVGIENIFKFIRIDAMWRLTYLDHPNTSNFGIRGAFEFTF